MPQKLVLHILDTLPFGCVGDKDGWFASFPRSSFQCDANGFVIVSVNFSHRPAKGAEFVRKRRKLQNFLH